MLPTVETDTFLTRWPKTPPTLSTEQLQAREQFMMEWHKMLPSKYGIIERFNHGWVAKLPIKPASQTLEIGAGIGEHIKWENLDHQTYFQLEHREDFCKQLRKDYGTEKVVCADIHQQVSFKNASFDRIIAIHVLEHLTNLPKALAEISRLMKPDGVFDVVIPCEGGLLYSFARKISAQRFFEKKFRMPYKPIIQNEHVNTGHEVLEALKHFFDVQKTTYFPAMIPILNSNLCIGLRLVKKRS